MYDKFMSSKSQFIAVLKQLSNKDIA